MGSLTIPLISRPIVGVDFPNSTASGIPTQPKPIIAILLLILKSPIYIKKSLQMKTFKFTREYK